MDSPDAKVIVVVEDEIDVRDLLAKRLRQAGYSVYEAADGEEALVLIDKHRPDLVISDVLMQPMNGGQLVKALRGKDWGKYIRVMVITARGNMRDYFDDQAVDDFLVKPVGPYEIIARVRRLMAQPPKDLPGQENPVETRPDEPQPRVPEAVAAPSTDAATVTAQAAPKPSPDSFFIDISICFLYGASLIIFLVIFMLNNWRGK